MRTLIGFAVLSLFVFGIVTAGEAPAPEKREMRLHPAYGFDEGRQI